MAVSGINEMATQQSQLLDDLAMEIEFYVQATRKDGDILNEAEKVLVSAGEAIRYEACHRKKGEETDTNEEKKAAPRVKNRFENFDDVNEAMIESVKRRLEIDENTLSLSQKILNIEVQRAQLEDARIERQNDLPERNLKLEEVGIEIEREERKGKSAESTKMLEKMDNMYSTLAQYPSGEGPEKQIPRAELANVQKPDSGPQGPLAES